MVRDDRPRGAARILVASVQGWQRADAPLHAAAVAYYTLFSTAPLMFLVFNIAARVFADDVAPHIAAAMTRALGPTAATLALNLLAPQAVHTGGGWAALVAFGLLVFGASSVFLRLRLSVNAMWGLTPAPSAGGARSGLVSIVWQRAVAAGTALALGLVLLASVVLNALSSRYLRPLVAAVVPGFDGLELAGGALLAPILFILIIAGLFKWLPEAEVRWRHVWPGAVVAGLLFWVGAHALGLYVAFAINPSVQAAAASVMAFLVWGYFSALSLLFGARLVAEVALSYGDPVRPGRGWQRE